MPRPNNADSACNPYLATTLLLAADPFITYKTEEWRAYHLTVSQWEIDR